MRGSLARASQGIASVDHQALAGDEAGYVRSEKIHGVSYCNQTCALTWPAGLLKTGRANQQ